MMKKLWMLLAVVLLLSGCAVQETFETMGDLYDVPASVTVYEIQLQLPEAAAQFVMEDVDGGKFYQCDGYTVYVQTLAGGDLARTFRQVTGLEKDALTVMQTQQGSFKRYESAWSAAGEDSQLVCRTLILDDGHVHHAVTVMADHTLAGKLQDEWAHIFSTASLVSTG